MPALPVPPWIERTPETDLLLTLLADVAAGRTRLRVVTDASGDAVELHLTPLGEQAVDLPHVPDAEHGVLASLSPRECSMLCLVADGLTNRQIARELHLAETTVRNQLSLVFAKLGIERRSQAAAFAVRSGLADTAG